MKVKERAEAEDNSVPMADEAKPKLTDGYDDDDTIMVANVDADEFEQQTN